MDTRGAVWIDHERAVVLLFTSYGTVIERISSEVGKRVRMAGGSRARTMPGGQDVSDEPSREARHQQQLHRYYQRVIRSLAKAETLYLCGPGEARLELRKLLIAAPGGAGRIAACEPADRMTDRQFQAHARRFYEAAPVRGRRATGV